jgi:hypothetical protein
MGGVQIALMGNSSEGKSFSLRTLDPKTTFILTPNTKDLPFRGSAKNYPFMTSKNVTGNRGFCKLLATTRDRSGAVLQKGLIDWIKYINDKRPEITNLVIEDITHFFHARTQDPSFRDNSDWGKWGDFAADVLNAIIDTSLYRENMNVIHIYHSEVVEQNGKTLSRILTQGKALNNKIMPSSYYTYCLHSKVLDYDDYPDAADRYKFITNNDGEHDCKTPHEMFPIEIPNDINAVIERIHEYRMEEEA